MHMIPEDRSPGERWLSAQEVARHLGVRPGTVYKWVERGDLPARKVGRLLKFRCSEVDAWVERTSRKPHAIHETAAAYVPGAEPAQALIRRLTGALPEIRSRFGVRKIGLFGSAARGELKPESDIDILVEFNEPTFDAYMDLKFYLEDLFGRTCDLVLADSLKPDVRPDVLAEVVYA